ncbi:MAG TPA: hypothetical protein VL201_05835, partial [Patescibacteria group bacterium]|nr:hypothetical protein [Patescibacteria group bacterium]
PRLAVVAQPVGSSPAFFNPNDDNKNKHPNGIYEDADYHGLTQNGRKSPRPKDGQKALDNSISVDGTNGQRVAIEGNTFVILRKTIGNIYHGHTMTWAELEGGGGKYQGIINTLLNNGLVRRSGKIVK